jgi:hypothetical protein
MYKTNKGRNVTLVKQNYGRGRERERDGAPKSNVPTSWSLWLTLKLALIIQCSGFFSAYPMRCFRIPHVEDHYTTRH